MLRFNFQRVFALRGIEQPYKFLKELGFSVVLSYKIIYSQNASIQLKHLELLCRELHCTPNDLMEYVPKDNENNSTHPLLTLHRKTKTDLIEAFSTIPIEKLEEFINNMKEKPKN